MRAVALCASCEPACRAKPSTRCEARPLNVFYHEASGDKKLRRTLRAEAAGYARRSRPRRTLRLAFGRRVESIVMPVFLVQQPGAPSPTWTRDSASGYSSGHLLLLFPRNRTSRIQNTGYAEPAAPRPFCPRWSSPCESSLEIWHDLTQDFQRPSRANFPSTAPKARAPMSRAIW